MLRGLLVRLSRSAKAERFFRGFAPTRSVISRFIAGDSLADGVAVARERESAGFATTLDLLGESGDEAAVARALDGIEEAVEAAAGLERCSVSVKPTQIGLDQSREALGENLARIAKATRAAAVPLTVEMEGSPTADDTLEAFEAVRGDDLSVGCVLQSYLRRSPDDLLRLMRRPLRLRLVKGAYEEPHPVAFRRRDEIDDAYLRLARTMMGEGVDSGGYPEIATHDPAIAGGVLALAEEAGRGPADFEFQMLYGVNRALQERLRAEGWTVRVYIPFGSHWYPYFMRRLAERPANLWFFARAMFGS